MGEQMLLSYSVADNMPVFNVKDINSSFASGSIKVMYLGANRNGSSFSKKAVESALPSMKNVPIVCNYNIETNEIGGHDVAVVTDEDGNMRLRNMTSPIGVVPESATYSFESAPDAEGNEHEYLVINNVVLWKRQDAYDHIVNDLGGVIGHSMEVRVKNGSTNSVNGLYDVTDFEFTALCLLETATPCFQGSELEIHDKFYSIMEEQLNEFNTQMETMVAEWKETFAHMCVLEDDDSTHDQFAEGGEKMPEDKIALIEEFGFKVEELDFDVAEFSIDELRGKLEELKMSLNNDSDASAETAEAEPQADKQEEFELAGNVRESLEGAVHANKVNKPWGEEPCYHMVEYDQDEHMVYVIDCAEGCTLYGIPYTMNGDEPVLDMENKKRMKWAIVEYDGGEQNLPFSGMFERASDYISDVENEKASVMDKYQKMSDDMESLNNEVSELRKFKAEIEEKENADKMNSVFAMFEDLNGVEAFEALKENHAEYSVEDVEEKCFAIRGRMAQVAKFSYSEKAPKIKVVNEHSDNALSNPYGGVVEYYANKNN